MYSIDDLLGVVHSDGADGLELHIGQPPIVIMDGQPHQVDWPANTPEEAQHLLRSITDTRQRRELREMGVIEFLYRFRDRVTFVVRATLQDGQLALNIR